MAIDLEKLAITSVPSPKESPQESIFSFLNKDIKLFGSAMNDRKKERFFSEVHVLLGAGVDIRTALELLENEAEKKEEKILYGEILKAVVNGATLADALEATKKFSSYEFFSLRIGEESGRMKEVLKDLSEYYSRKIKQKRKVKSALSYPVVVITVAVAAVGFMLRFVVPMFAEMLKRFHTELPGITKWIIHLSDVSAQWGPWIILSIIGFILFARSQRQQQWYRKISSSVLLRIPYAGRIAQKVYLERFCHSMHLLLASKTTLITSLDLVRKMIGFYPIEQSLGTIEKDIMGGNALHTSMAKFPVYQKRMISLIRVAEEVNQLDLMFDKLSKQLSEEIEHETSVLGSVIEPIMIIFLGLMVAMILVAMYLPMFKLSTAFG
jgi:type IV pilus assembly protein PilC